MFVGRRSRTYAGDFTDRVAQQLRNLILHRFGFDPGKEHIHDALQTASARLLTSIRCEDYFDGLRWDGMRRLESILINYFGAADTDFNRSVG